MNPQINIALARRLAAPLLWIVAGLPALAACAAEVEVFRLGQNRAAAAADAGATSTTTVLIDPGAAPVSADGRCQPGHYVGTFNGTYNSAAWGNGSEPLSIAATPSLGRPGLEFWLERIPRNCGSDEEFCADYTVNGGKIRGYANPFFRGSASSNDPLVVAVRLEIDFGGELDCESGLFRGLLQNGCYDLATILFRFEGTAPAYYDPVSASFNDGLWMVKELAPENAWLPPDSDIGGMGNWQASWANDAVGPAAQGVGLCDK